MSHIRNILICGGGLAGHMTAAALAHNLPSDIEITLVDTPGADSTDIFYGTVTSPTTYEFLLNMGVTEPELLLGTNTAFSLGTQFKNWGSDKRSWIQSFHIPLPIFQGVGFHHYISRLQTAQSEESILEPYIMSVQAAHKGVFVHPPEDRKTPLSSVEYGYQFTPDSWTNFFAKRAKDSRIHLISGVIETVQHDGDNISAISLVDGRELSADLFIDCSGPNSKIAEYLNFAFTNTRKLRARTAHTPVNAVSAVCRQLSAAGYGWASTTALQDGTQHVTIYAAENEDAAIKEQIASDGKFAEVQLARRRSAWTGNCVSIGQNAAILEPLTPAPMMMMQHDIERLLALIPVSANMIVEAREYNRRFDDDYNHISIFQRAFFERENHPDGTYWQAACSDVMNDKLKAKIEQFESRGVFVQYDYEPFNQQDWAMLHFGLGRTPKRYDRLADRIPNARIENTLAQMRNAITMMAKKMPPHATYMSGLLKYLKENHD